MVRPPEHPEDRLGRSHDAVDLRGPLGRVVGEVVQRVAHGLLAPRPLGGDHGGVEAGVAHAPGEAAHHGVPQLGGADQVVEHPLVALADVVGQRVGVAQPPAQQVEEHGHVHGGAPVREEHPVQRRGQRVGLLQVGHAVVGQRLAQLGPERLGQPLGVGVAGAQVGVEVLLRVARLLARRVDLLALVFGSAPVARQRAEVGEDAEDRELALQHGRVVGRQVLAGRVEGGQQRTGVALVDVVAEHEVAQRGERIGGHGGGVGARDRRRGEAPQRRALGTADHGVVGVRLQPQQLRAALDLGVRGDQDLLHAPGDRGLERRLQLHALDDRDDVARRHLVAHRDRDRDDHRGRRARAPCPPRRRRCGARCRRPRRGSRCPAAPTARRTSCRRR